MSTDATMEAPAEPNTRPPADAQALDAMVEAVLLSLDRPAGADRVAEALSGVAGQGLEPAGVEAAVDRLNGVYERTGRAFRIERVGGGLRVMTLPRFAPALAAFQKARASGRLSKAALETLAIIAYRQPVTRAKLEAIRGVACGEVLRSLLDRKLVMIKGRAEELGRPMLYGTTRQFLDQFGLASLKDLPEAAELADARGRTGQEADGA